MPNVEGSPWLHSRIGGGVDVPKELPEILVLHIVVLNSELILRCTFVCDVVRRVGQQHIGLFAAHEFCYIVETCRVSA